MQTEINDGRRDVERAIAVLAERLPAPLQPLARLVYNYRWSWLPGGADLFRHIDPSYWRRSGCNPRYVIEGVPPSRLRDLAGDPGYVARVQGIAEAVRQELEHPPAVAGMSPAAPVAYFCSEYGFHCSLPLYGGGLGVLAGDTLKGASDLGLPMVGIGLLYRQGYFEQRFDLAGWQHEYWITTDFDRLPAVRVTGADGRPLAVEVVIRGRVVVVQVWRIDVGRVPLYLLDTDCEENHPIDRWITARLYIGDKHTRLSQYAVLGVGGVRALAAMGVRPAVVHLNEGHAALGSYERIRALIAEGGQVEEAIAAVRARTVFTTHTPVPAGNEGYPPADMEQVLGDFISDLGMPRESFYGLGRVTPANGHEPVSITPLALHTCRLANGVSRRHGEVARAMWHPLWPDRPLERVPITHVTNGVHIASWMAAPMQELLDRHLGRDWRERVTEPGLWERIDAIPDAELWAVRERLREQLVDFVREKSISDRIGRGENAAYVEAAARVFDPNVFTVGFARRAATYKRLYLLTRAPERGLRLLADGPHAVQVVVSGKAHPQDHEAKQTLQGIFQLRATREISQRSAYIENYNLHIAPRIIAGVDLWLNLPRPPLEASGTSGMKVTLNGGLNLSVLDGWWTEGYNGENGWAITSPDADPGTQDEHDAHALFDLLEGEVIPMFYERDADGIPRRWVARVKTAMRTLIPQFSTERMLGEYLSKMYA